VPLLILEFTALATLLGSMIWFCVQYAAEGSYGARLVADTGCRPACWFSPVFIGLMYLALGSCRRRRTANRHKLIFALMGIDHVQRVVYGMANTGSPERPVKLHPINAVFLSVKGSETIYHHYYTCVNNYPAARHVLQRQ